MAEVLLFHHAQGQTPGFTSFANELRQAGHTVHTPDLFDGRTFDSIDEGMAHVGEVGFWSCSSAVSERRTTSQRDSSTRGFSFGVVAAQKLAQTRPGARGALLFYSACPMSEFGEWPAEVPVQIHGMDADPYFVGEGDIDAARELVESTGNAELFLYPGTEHYFADSSLPSYDAEAATLLTKRVLEFLDAV